MASPFIQGGVNLRLTCLRWFHNLPFLCASSPEKSRRCFDQYGLKERVSVEIAGRLVTRNYYAETANSPVFMEMTLINLPCTRTSLRCRPSTVLLCFGVKQLFSLVPILQEGLPELPSW